MQDTNNRLRLSDGGPNEVNADFEPGLYDCTNRLARPWLGLDQKGQAPFAAWSVRSTLMSLSNGKSICSCLTFAKDLEIAVPWEHSTSRSLGISKVLACVSLVQACHLAKSTWSWEAWASHSSAAPSSTHSKSTRPTRQQHILTVNFLEIKS
jgi:hypothetical protein